VNPVINPSGGGGSGGAQTQISDSTLGGSAPSFDLTAIPATFNHLLLLIQGRGDTAATSTTVLLRFNNDSGANYDTELITGSGAAVATGEIVAGTSAQIADITANTGPASVFGAFTIWIPNYAGTTAQKNAFSSGGHKTTSLSGGIFNRNYSCFWRSAAAINRITLTPGAGNFVAGSRVTLYGLT
jgi:hypothetical protein